MTESHPVEVVERLACVYGDDITLQFGVYVYIPQTLSDERKIHDIHFHRMRSWFAESSQGLRPGEEIALQSIVRIGRSESAMHLPMVDFHESAKLDDLKETIGKLREYGLAEFFPYDSGRSFHLYCLPLIQEEEISGFFGRLLLLNEPKRNPTVDLRWIGHRLIAGYAALRWSANNSHYKKTPTRIPL